MLACEGGSAREERVRRRRQGMAGRNERVVWAKGATVALPGDAMRLRTHKAQRAASALVRWFRQAQLVVRVDLLW